ncbi:MAG TPA: phosphodiester glycosidase family protein [Verrucomicrobiae bacterium]|nr:phosphodiester glycosidase family protein [Verrucomicrobiae bacterium]
MTTNTAAISARRELRLRCPNLLRSVWLTFAVALLSGSILVPASPSPGPWTPLFKGIDLAVGTNDPAIPGNFPRLQVVRCVRIDLTDPDIRLFATPRASGYAPESRETLTQSVPNFLRQNLLQIASDANYYDAFPGGSDPTAEGISCEASGLQICTGQVVSAQTTADESANVRTCSLLFSTNNHPFVVFVNSPPGTNTTGIYTAITGYYPLVSNGVNIAAAAATSYPDSFIHGVQPRTAFGVSQDNRYLYLMTLDGRQNGYSDGALDTETAYWLMQFGAWNGINMDGGGSTAMYMADSAGNAVGLNHSSYLSAYGHERYVGSHFGVYAKALPGPVNDVTAFPDDTAASISWTTTSASTSLVQYGPTPSLGFASPFSAAMVTNHSALLTNLAPGTLYYYRVFSSDGINQYSAGPFVFTTLNYATTNLLFDFTNVWTYGTANLDGVNWTAPAYDDSGWAGSGPGLLWVDTRGFPNASIPLPMLTQMPANGVNPYPTYYFRTHFNFTNNLKGVTLLVSDYLDDGAVFYLNGQEINRLRMPATPIVNATLASGFACSGDATCPDNWSVSGDLATNLVTGDNVLAVEAHNYNAGSPDITFGLALSYTEPYAAPPALNIQQSNSIATVTWSRGGFALQQASSPVGPWTAVPGPVVLSPYSTTNTGQAVYYRLIK